MIRARITRCSYVAGRQPSKEKQQLFSGGGVVFSVWSRGARATQRAYVTGRAMSVASLAMRARTVSSFLGLLMAAAGGAGGWAIRWVDKACCARCCARAHTNKLVLVLLVKFMSRKFGQSHKKLDSSRYFFHPISSAPTTTRARRGAVSEPDDSRAEG